jgi:hypothetical protein
MVDWEHTITLCMEQITWGWHPMHHILTTPLPFNVLPPFPWTHNKNEAPTIIVTIFNMEKSNLLWPTPYTMLLVKMFLFTWCIKQAKCHPINGRTRENTMEWLNLCLNDGPWCLIKRMLQEEGFFLFASCMNVHSCQEWRQ